MKVDIIEAGFRFCPGDFFFEMLSKVSMPLFGLTRAVKNDIDVRAKAC
jgi:hypothetical protein